MRTGCRRRAGGRVAVPGQPRGHGGCAALPAQAGHGDRGEVREWRTATTGGGTRCSGRTARGAGTPTCSTIWPCYAMRAATAAALLPGRIRAGDPGAGSDPPSPRLQRPRVMSLQKKRPCPRTGYSCVPGGSGILPLDDPSPSHAAGPSALQSGGAVGDGNSGRMPLPLWDGARVYPEDHPQELVDIRWAHFLHTRTSSTALLRRIPQGAGYSCVPGRVRGSPSGGGLG